MSRATKVAKCQNKVFFRIFFKNLIFVLFNLSSLATPIDGNLITLFVGEQEGGKAKRAFRVRQAGEAAFRPGKDWISREWSGIGS